MITSETAASRPSLPVPPPIPAAEHHGFSFRQLLSVLNPLQYLPVVGTIYRAVTGDVIPEGARIAGSMMVSGLLGGPVGLLLNIATTIAEKVTGIDPEKIVAAQFHPTLAERHALPATVPAAATPLAFTRQQLAAYGVREHGAGAHRTRDVGEADVLNGMELDRLHKAAVAYSAPRTLPFMPYGAASVG
jgi:hypothetical protein